MQQTFPFQEATLKQQEAAAGTTSTGHANSPAPIIIRRKTTQTPKVFRRGQKQPCPVSQPGSVGAAADLEGLSSLLATPRGPPQGKITFQTHFTYHSIIITYFLSVKSKTSLYSSLNTHRRDSCAIPERQGEGHPPHLTVPGAAPGLAQLPVLLGLCQHFRQLHQHDQL